MAQTDNGPGTEESTWLETGAGREIRGHRRARRWVSGPGLRRTAVVVTAAGLVGGVIGGVNALPHDEIRRPRSAPSMNTAPPLPLLTAPPAETTTTATATMSPPPAITTTPTAPASTPATTPPRSPTAGKTSTPTTPIAPTSTKPPATTTPVNPVTPTPTPSWQTTQIAATRVLTAGQSWSSNRLRLTLTSGGDVTLTDQGGTVWRTGTAGRGASRLVMQADGNLGLYDPAGATIWTSRTEGHDGAVLVLRSDGDLLITLGGAVLWHTGTGD